MIIRLLAQNIASTQAYKRSLLHNQKLIVDIGKPKYAVNLHLKQGTSEIYKDKILKVLISLPKFYRYI